MEELTLTFSNLHLLVTIGKIVKLIKMANKKFEFNKSLKDLNVTDLKARIEEDELRLKKLEFAHAISPSKTL